MKTNKLIYLPLSALLLTSCVSVKITNPNKPNLADEISSTDQIAANLPSQKKLDTSNLTTVDQLQIEDILVGEGEETVTGSLITVHYTGSLTNGEVFDSSVGGEPFTFTLGQGSVIQGWDQGLVGMKVGGKRKLTIPAKLAYGDTGNGEIPPGATLLFEVELINVRTE